MKRISLDGEWQLAYREERGSVAHPDDLATSGCASWVPALVPGNVELDLVRAGVTAEEIAIAEAAVAQAEAALQTAQATLDQATLHAPSAGTVTTLEINPGETVMPGQVVLVLANLQQLRVETTDLGEQDIGQVAVGQKATVYIEPLEIEIAGQGIGEMEDLLDPDSIPIVIRMSLNALLNGIYHREAGEDN